MLILRFKKFLPEIIIACLLIFNFGCQALRTDPLRQSDLAKQKRIATLYQKLASEFEDIAIINASELQQKQDQEKLMIVDVRPDHERNISIIPGAISQAEFEKHSDLYKVKPIVVYCTIGYRSGKYAKELYEQGFQVSNLVGGILSWSHIQGDLVNNTGATNQVHVYKQRFKLVADGYQAVW